MKRFDYEDSSANLRAIAEEIYTEDRLKMALRDEAEQYRPEEAGRTYNVADPAEPQTERTEQPTAVQRLLAELEQGQNRNRDYRRALHILQAHPEFEDFLWLLRSGLVR